jgi:hypothetical protein
LSIPEKFENSAGIQPRNEAERKPMKILVRSRDSGLFLREGGGWTQDLTKAQNFGTGVAAVDKVLSLRLSHADVIMRSSDARVEDVVIKLGSRGQKPEREPGWFRLPGPNGGSGLRT